MLADTSMVGLLDGGFLNFYTSFHGGSWNNFTFYVFALLVCAVRTWKAGTLFPLCSRILQSLLQCPGVVWKYRIIGFWRRRRSPRKLLEEFHTFST